jgi:hypothetical protein
MEAQIELLIAAATGERRVFGIEALSADPVFEHLAGGVVPSIDTVYRGLRRFDEQAIVDLEALTAEDGLAAVRANCRPVLHLDVDTTVEAVFGDHEVGTTPRVRRRGARTAGAASVVVATARRRLVGPARTGRGAALGPDECSGASRVVSGAGGGPERCWKRPRPERGASGLPAGLAGVGHGLDKTRRRWESCRGNRTRAGARLSWRRCRSRAPAHDVGVVLLTPTKAVRWLRHQLAGLGQHFDDSRVVHNRNRMHPEVATFAWRLDFQAIANQRALPWPQHVCSPDGRVLRGARGARRGSRAVATMAETLSLGAQCRCDFCVDMGAAGWAGAFTLIAAAGFGWIHRVAVFATVPLVVCAGGYDTWRFRRRAKRDGGATVSTRSSR